MKIKKKRVNSIENYISHIPENAMLVVMMEIIDQNENIINSLEIPDGQSAILPKSSLGTASFYNAEGKIKKRKDLPMESYILELPYEVQDRWGNRHYGVNYIERQRYPREFIPPFGVYIQILQREERNFLVSSPIQKIECNKEKIKNTINMFLDRFGECYVVEENFNIDNYIQLNWEILPIGEYPWNTTKHAILSWIRTSPTKRIFSDRIDYLHEFQPDFVAKGIHGFHGYTIFWYTDRNYFICESIKYGNATYIFNEDREVLSHLTKWEIITWSRSFRRVIHSASRNRDIQNLFA